MNTLTRRIGSVLAAGLVVLLAGCVSPGGYVGNAGGGYGQPGGSYGQPGTGYPSQYASQLEGTVEGVDARYGRILLRVDDRRTGRSQRQEVRYDRRTRLFYQGREYPVEGLERGDVIRIDLAQSGRDLWAGRIEVVHNIRDRGYGGGHDRGYDDRYGDPYGNPYGGDPYGDPYGSANGQDLRGQVAFVDRQARVIQLEGSGYGGGMQVRYDSRTTAEHDRRLLRPEDLQRGAVVRIQGRAVGNNGWLAEHIIVERAGGR